MSPYVADGGAPIDNKVILERDIRPFTTGRKAWIFNRLGDHRESQRNDR
jgi:transposase